MSWTEGKRQVYASHHKCTDNYVDNHERKPLRLQSFYLKSDCDSRLSVIVRTKTRKLMEVLLYPHEWSLIDLSPIGVTLEKDEELIIENKSSSGVFYVDILGEVYPSQHGAFKEDKDTRNPRVDGMLESLEMIEK